jgi:nuclear protein localization protein 4 homolog
LSKIPPTVDPTSIKFSNSHSGGDEKHIGEIARFKVSQIGMRQAILSPCWCDTC